MNTSKPADTSAAPSTTLLINGMSCDHCVRAVSGALAAVPGLSVSSVAIGRAVVQTASTAALTQAIAALDDAGFEAAVATAPNTAPNSGGCCGGPRGCCN